MLMVLITYAVATVLMRSILLFEVFIVLYEELTVLLLSADSSIEMILHMATSLPALVFHESNDS